MGCFALSHSRTPPSAVRSKVPAFLNIVDIAGLVKGAAEGQGLGNAFLSHIGACDAIFHLCRAFDDDDVIHVEGDVNPVRDFDIIAEELRLKDEETLLKNLDKLERTCIRGNDKKLKPEYVSTQTHFRVGNVQSIKCSAHRGAQLDRRLVGWGCTGHIICVCVRVVVVRIQTISICVCGCAFKL